jgi:hypothetical protein
MNARHLSFVLAAVTLVTLSACGEKPQGMGGVKSDQAPHAGVGKSQYANKEWKPGDKSSWEQQLKARAQYGQNDYSRTAN